MNIYQIPIDQIDAAAITRDRIVEDGDALRELTQSILKGGLRQPVEVYALPTPGAKRYGLISGFRRLSALRELSAQGFPQFATIPAFVRAPASAQAAYAAMVEENEIRQQLSPYERARITVEATQMELFPSIEDAINGLYPQANAAKRSRLRAIAQVVSELDGALSQPEALTVRQAMRIANALRLDYGCLLYTSPSPRDA